MPGSLSIAPASPVRSSGQTRCPGGVLSEPADGRSDAPVRLPGENRQPGGSSLGGDGQAGVPVRTNNKVPRRRRQASSGNTSAPRPEASPPPGHRLLVVLLAVKTARSDQTFRKRPSDTSPPNADDKLAPCQPHSHSIIGQQACARKSEADGLLEGDRNGVGAFPLPPVGNPEHFPCKSSCSRSVRV